MEKAFRLAIFLFFPLRNKIVPKNLNLKSSNVDRNLQPLHMLTIEITVSIQDKRVAGRETIAST